MKRKRRILNNNGIGLLLLINAILLFVNILQQLNSDSIKEVVYASDYQTDEKRKNDDNESNDEETFTYTFKIDSVAHHSEIEGFPMYFSHADEKGAYFTYMETEYPKEWKDGYWFVTHEALEKGSYDIDLLSHNDELRSIFISGTQSNRNDFMMLKHASDSGIGYAH